MVVDDMLLMATLKGKRIKLTLKTASYFGVIQRINPNKSLVLADVVSGSNGSKIPGTKLVFGRDIVNVEFTNDGDHGNTHSLGEQLTVEKFQPYKKLINFDDNEDLEEFINFVVIDEFHEKFAPAVMHIKKQHVIGVGFEGVEVFKNGRLCWLQIATKNKVYLFDVLLLGAQAFKNGLSMILESKQILKVIHDCRFIAGCLISQFGVKLTNVFDTQVADVMCFYSETGGFLPDRVSTFQEVVSLHLKVPSSQLSSLQMKDQLTKEEREMWYTRPCPLPLLKVMALSVIHLLPLRLVLLDTLMTDYMALVDSYLSSSFYQPDELEHVSMDSVLVLPRELRQLDQMRQERRVLAGSRYPVTEQGLLARFNPHPQTSAHTSHSSKEHSKTEPDFFEPASVETPSSPLLDLHVSQHLISPVSVSVSSVDVNASSNLPDQVLASAAVSDFQRQTSTNSPLSSGGPNLPVGMMGRGRPLPSIGRGFLLPNVRDGITRARMEMAPSCLSHLLTQNLTPQNDCYDDNLPKDIHGTNEKHFTLHTRPVPSPLVQSFRSFRH